MSVSESRVSQHTESNPHLQHPEDHEQQPAMSSPQDSKASTASPASPATHNPQHPPKPNPSFQEPRVSSSARPDKPPLPRLDTNLVSPSMSLPRDPPKPTLQHEDRLRTYTPYPPDPYSSLHSPRHLLVPHPQPQPHQPRAQGRKRPSLPQIVVTSVAGDSTGSASLEVPNEPRAPTTASARRFFGNEEGC